MARHYEVRLVCDALRSIAVLGNQLANTSWNPTPLQVGGEIQADERGEIFAAEIYSPVTGAGVDEDLRAIEPVLDGVNYGSYVRLSGIRATVMAPPKDRIWAGRLYTFGDPGNIDPFKNTTLKFKQNVTISALCGPGGPITQDYRVRLWAIVYRDVELPFAFPGGRMTFPVPVTEFRRRRGFTLSKMGPDGQPGIPVNADTWLTLPGGKDQAIPKINPFVRFAYNLLATDGRQGDYQFRFTAGAVADERENMYWEFDNLDALFIEGLGVKAAADLDRTGLRIDGDYHPKGPTPRTDLFPTTPGINELNFGHMFPFAPVTHPYYVAIPKLPQPYMIWNEIGYPVIRDDGVAAVAANSVVLALTGIRIEMRG